MVSPLLSNAGPLSISASTRVRTLVTEAGMTNGPVTSHDYVALDADDLADDLWRVHAAEDKASGNTFGNTFLLCLFPLNLQGRMPMLPLR